MTRRKALTHEEVTKLPRTLNQVVHCGRWYSTPLTSTFTCNGRLFEQSVDVRISKNRQGWQASIQKSPRVWNDPLSVEPFVEVDGADPVEVYKTAVEEARQHLEPLK